MNTFQNIFCFGDSWGYGSELNPGEKNFCEVMSEKFNIPLKNYSEPNMSLGLITRLLSLKINEITDKDLVLVVIPPDARWYTEWKTLNFEDISFFKDKSDDWFYYHQQLFIFSICELLNKVGCKYLLMHNYGEYPLIDRGYIFSKFSNEKFLDTRSLTELLTNNSSTELSPIKVEKYQGIIFSGPYFNESHPNQEGHKKIAEFIINRIE